MLHFIGAVIAGLVGLFVALFGIGLGLGAMLIALAPLIFVLLILMLPVLFLLGILRGIGLLRGPFMTFLALFLIVFLMLGGARHFWQSGTDRLQAWLDDTRSQIDQCREEGSQDLDFTFDGHALVFTCKGADKQEKQPGDAHI